MFEKEDGYITLSLSAYEKIKETSKKLEDRCKRLENENDSLVHALSKFDIPPSIMSMLGVDIPVKIFVQDVFTPDVPSGVTKKYTIEFEFPTDAVRALENRY